MVEVPNMENKMGESVGSLGMSVSFGKYETDALSWEKWSTFSSPNKYLEEVGKCSTPGSVAQKKAFFEAHYKKIAAMKAEAELMDQEKARESCSDPLRSDDHTEDSFEEVKEEYKGRVERKVCQDEEEVQAEISLDYHEDKSGSDQSHCAEEANSVNNESFQDEPQNLLTKALNRNTDKLEEATSVNDETVQEESLQVTTVLTPMNLLLVACNADKVEEATSVNDESCNALEPQDMLPIALNSSVNKLEEAVLVNDESMKLVKEHFHLDSKTVNPQEIKREIPIQKAQNVPRKVNPTKVEKNFVGMKKKQASVIPKSPDTPVTRLSKPKPKPKPTPTPLPAVRSSSKKTVASSSSLSLLKSKNHSVSESRPIAPMSLHLSMSMNSVQSDTASTEVSSKRRSLFMEQMGDKDIVKRAFKTFQNRVNQLASSEGTSTRPKQIPTKRSEQKTMTSMASQKENERSRKAAEKIKPARGQLGPRWKSVSTGSLKGVGVDERRLKAAPATSLALRSNERAERRKEFFKNLEEKSNAREAERIQLSEKSKEVKDAKMKKLRQNLAFKAKPMPSFYQAQGLSKSTSEKEAIKNGTSRRPDSHR